MFDLDIFVISKWFQVETSNATAPSPFIGCKSIWFARFRRARLGAFTIVHIDRDHEIVGLDVVACGRRGRRPALHAGFIPNASGSPGAPPVRRAKIPSARSGRGRRAAQFSFGDGRAANLDQAALTDPAEMGAAKPPRVFQSVAHPALHAPMR